VLQPFSLKRPSKGLCNAVSQVHFILDVLYLILFSPSTTDDLLFSCLSPANLFRYAATCKTARSSVSSYCQRAFKIGNQLKNFFTEEEILYFRYWQSRTGMLISGSTALQFLDRSFYPDSDLDIYVEHLYADRIAYWLFSIGYEFVSRKRQTKDFRLAYQEIHHGTPHHLHAFFPAETIGYFGKGVAEVYDFHKSHPDRKIQLITSYHSPLEVVFDFHSSKCVVLPIISELENNWAACVMNFITHEKAYSLYPRATFEERRSLHSSHASWRKDSQTVARTKYARRGWLVVDRLTQSEIDNRTSAFAYGRRAVGDQYCWTMELLPKLADLPQGFVESNSWGLSFTHIRQAEMKFMLLKMPELRFSYTVADEIIEAYLSPALREGVAPPFVPLRHRRFNSHSPYTLGGMT
jgi:hypothetical protein